jgi:hypothetical protein
MLPLWVVSICATCIHADEPRRLTSDGLLKQRPVWFADNRQLVFARHAESTIWLYVLDTETGVERRLTDRELPEFDAVPAADGRSLLIAFDKVTPGQGDIDIGRWQMDGGVLEPLIVTGAKLSHEEWPALCCRQVSTRKGSGSERGDQQRAEHVRGAFAQRSL